MTELEKKAQTGLAKIESIIKGAVVNSENKILHRRLRLIEFIILGCILAVSLVIWRLAGEARRERIRTTAEMAYAKDGFDLHDLGPNERREKYRKFMYRIFAEYSYRYNPRKVRAMNKKQRLRYVYENYEAAEMLGFGYYDVPAMHLLETAFNPLAEGGYGEFGIGQQKMGTVRYAERILQLMPARFRNKLAFRVTQQEDLFDPIVATRITYVLLYAMRREFIGREEWYISVYHWGGFLRRHWHKGEGNIPKIFTLNGIKYDVISYYLAYKELVESFEAGQVKPGKAIVLKYKRRKSKLMKEEVDLHNATKIIKAMRKREVKRTRLIKELTDHNKNLDKHLAKAERDIRAIFGIAKTGRVSRLRANLRKARGPVKTLLKKVEKDDKAKFILIISAAILVMLIVLAGFGYGSFRFVQYILRRWRKK